MRTLHNRSMHVHHTEREREREREESTDTHIHTHTHAHTHILSPCNVRTCKHTLPTRTPPQDISKLKGTCNTTIHRAACLQMKLKECWELLLTRFFRMVLCFPLNMFSRERTTGFFSLMPCFSFVSKSQSCRRA